MHCGEGVQFSIEMLSLLLVMISTCLGLMVLYSVLILENNLWRAPATQGWQTHLHGMCSRGDREVAQTYHQYACPATCDLGKWDHCQI